MNRSKLFVAVIFASACVNTLEGPPFDELEGAGGSAGAAAGGSPSGAMGGTAPQGGNPSGGSSGSFSGTSAIGGTSTGGTGVGGTLGGTNGVTLGGTNGTATGGLGGTAVTGGAGGVGARTGGGVAGSGALAGTGSGGMAGGTSASTFPAVRDLIVEVCADTTCHGSRERPLLTATNLYTTLTTTAVRQCGNDRLVTPGDTANSAILELINGQCGNLLMPESCMEAPCLGAGEQVIISSWIEAGAPP